MQARQGVAHRDGFDIWFDVHGPPGPPVMLLSGAALQAVLWEPPYLEPFVSAGYQVIRVDWRDMGLSTWGDFRERPYHLRDLAGDVLAVLDAEEIELAHLIGFSMGGIVAQHVVILDETRVQTLACLGAGFAGGMRLGDTTRGKEVVAYLMGSRPAADELEAWLLGQWQLLAGRDFPFDVDEWQQRVAGWMERGQNPRCPHLRIPQYQGSVDDPTLAPEAIRQSLSEVRVSTLVLHGDDDGMFTPSNGQQTAATIPGARHVVLPGRGHDLFLDPTGEIAPLLLEHLAGATTPSE